VPRPSPSLRWVAAAALVLVVADWAYRLVGDSVVPGGPLDEIAHLTTTLIVLWALGRRVRARFLVPALVASVAIDADHVPRALGYDFFTQGTPRPYTHSLLSIAVVLILGWFWHARRDVLLGVALGLAIHFWRDMSESGAGVSLAWPVSEHSFMLSHKGYLAAVALCAAVVAARCRQPSTHSTGRTESDPEGAGAEGLSTLSTKVGSERLLT
jgi:inner membrane protein